MANKRNERYKRARARAAVLDQLEKLNIPKRTVPTQTVQRPSYDFIWSDAQRAWIRNFILPLGIKYTSPLRLDTCEEVSQQKQETETTMYFETNKVEPAIQRYLQRVNEIMWAKQTELASAYGITGDRTPSSPKDIVDRILAGKYILPDEDTIEKCACFCCDSPVDVIIWRDPAIKVDRAGYDVAFKALDKAKTDALDLIIASTPIDALAALKAFEAFPTTVAAAPASA